MNSQLPPREIQARIRAGESAEDVATAAQTSLDRVMVYAVPVLAERAHVAGLAQRSSVRRTGGGEGARTLEESVDARLRPVDVDPGSVDWDAWRRLDQRWTLVADFTLDDTALRARFVYDAAGKYVVAEDDAARWMVGETDVRPGGRVTRLPTRATQPTQPDSEAGTPTGDLVGGAVDDPDPAGPAHLEREVVEEDVLPAPPGATRSWTPWPGPPGGPSSAPRPTTCRPVRSGAPATTTTGCLTTSSPSATTRSPWSRVARCLRPRPRRRRVGSPTTRRRPGSGHRAPRPRPPATPAAPVTPPDDDVEEVLDALAAEKRPEEAPDDEEETVELVDLPGADDEADEATDVGVDAPVELGEPDTPAQQGATGDLPTAQDALFDGPLGADATEAEERPARASRRKGRASVPSWDEIMFGGSGSDSGRQD